MPTGVAISTDEPTIKTSYQALYGKLGRLQPAVSEAVVRYSAERSQQLLALNPPARDEPLPGYRMRVLDGNVLTGTDHRLTALRRWLNACLPGKSLVVFEPGSGLVTDLVLCEDAYTQERALLTQILPRVQANDLMVADRNFCTTRFAFGVQAQKGFFVVRQHKVNLPCVATSKLRKCGETETGQRDLRPMVVSAKLLDDVVEGSDPSDDRSQRGDGRDGRYFRADASGPSEAVE